MRLLKIRETANLVRALQAEIHRSKESRYDHRLHALLLVAQGLACPEVGRLLGDAPRTVEYWVRRFAKRGLAGLQEETRQGRPGHLNQTQLNEIEVALKRIPEDYGLGSGLWDGKTLATWLAQHYRVQLGVRQCQRILRKFTFQKRKPGAQRNCAGSDRQNRDGKARVTKH